MSQLILAGFWYTNTRPSHMLTSVLLVILHVDIQRWLAWALASFILLGTAGHLFVDVCSCATGEHSRRVHRTEVCEQSGSLQDSAPG